MTTACLKWLIPALALVALATLGTLARINADARDFDASAAFPPTLANASIHHLFPH